MTRIQRMDPSAGSLGDVARCAAAVLAALALLASAPISGGSRAAAQEADLPGADTVPVPGLTVTVTRAVSDQQRTPEAVSVLGRDAVAQGDRQVSLEEALRFVPGVYAQNRRNNSLGDRITVRGVGARAQFGVRGIQILMDGIPLTMPDGQATVDPVDLNSVGRVEVIRGAASTLYGNAAGGVISYRTRDPFAGDFRTEPDVSFGSHGYNKAVFGASGSSGDFGWRLTANRMETDGFRDHSEAELYQGNLVMGWDVSEDTRLQGIVNFFRTPFAENPSSLDRETALEDPSATRDLIVEMGAGQETTHGQGGVTLDHAFSDNHRVDATGWFTARDIRNPIPFSIIELERAAGGLRSQYQGSVVAGEVPIQWTTGVDVGIQSDQREEFENDRVGPAGGEARAGALLVDQRERVVSLGPFARLEMDLLPEWRLTLGARWDRYEFDVDDQLLSDGDDSGTRTLEEVSPMVGLTYSPHEALNLYAHWATSFETPTFSEFSNRPEGGGGLNPRLGAADTDSWELGAKGRARGANLLYDVAVYTADVSGALVPFSGPTEVAFFRNAGEVSRTGVETSLEWVPVPPLRWRLAYTYQDSEFEEFTPEGEDFSGNREPGVPEHQLTLGTAYTAPFGLTSEVNFRWVDAYPVNDANTAYNWSYRVVDLRFSMEDPGIDLGRLGLQPFLGVDNLFDERYNGSVIPNAFGGRYYEPAPGTTVYGGLSVGLSYR